MRQNLIKGLSLLFSVYSPLYPADALLLRLMKGRYAIAWAVGLSMLILLLDGIFGEGTGFTVAILLLSYITLHNVWTFLLKRYGRFGSLMVYPIHSWLRTRVQRMTGYRLKGTQLVEIHIDPILTKRVKSNVQAGLMIARDAKRMTQKWTASGETVSVVGTTYEGRLAEVATTKALRNVKRTIRKPGKCPWGSKLLYPNKSWETFIWEIGS
ncbi:hypothetical protein LLE49_22185 [Alicyclobacillus tolerans]|uniref:hypothetical protein n=1 Tax=Alicyclobacillus tolerans TaxID=90970 RepID=UPI001F2BF7F1|nr:hypothetical protein [Alicyclobacillus tolerans]MCF8567431.1 hypothetical protein [Alicyclobacillus tolerans]